MKKESYYSDIYGSNIIVESLAATMGLVVFLSFFFFLFLKMSFADNPQNLFSYIQLEWTLTFYWSLKHLCNFPICQMKESFYPSKIA